MSESTWAHSRQAERDWQLTLIELYLAGRFCRKCGEKLPEQHYCFCETCIARSKAAHLAHETMRRQRGRRMRENQS